MSQASGGGQGAAAAAAGHPPLPQLYSSLSLGSIPVQKQRFFNPAVSEDCCSSTVFTSNLSLVDNITEEESVELMDVEQKEAPPPPPPSQPPKWEVLEGELHEEKQRVDALKSCLELEREQRQNLEA